MHTATHERRHFLRMTSLMGSGLITIGAAAQSLGAEKEEKEKIGANEDLMREHGVLRRALLVYRAASERLRSDPAKVPADALMKTARLFHNFGEEYHERAQEEKHIFPLVRKLKGPIAAYPDVLEKQHNRGRELNEFVMQTAKGGKIASGNALPLARALSAFERMYEYHTAHEDTVVFVAWKNALSIKAYDEISEQFEQVEKQMFGEDGFEDAVRQITEIETQLGLNDLSKFTMAPPPKI